MAVMEAPEMGGKRRLELYYEPCSPGFLISRAIGCVCCPGSASQSIVGVPPYFENNDYKVVLDRDKRVNFSVP